ncbi:hypothetical protein SDJN03_06967, partial [Cucurbita argyrosperma subsp. sororia]
MIGAKTKIGSSSWSFSSSFCLCPALVKKRCVCFFKAYPGAATLGHPILLLSFPADLTSRAGSSCSGSSDERSSSDSEKSVKRGATLSSSSRATSSLSSPLEIYI